MRAAARAAMPRAPLRLRLPVAVSAAAAAAPDAKARDGGQSDLPGREGAALPVADLHAAVGADRGDGLQHTV